MPVHQSHEQLDGVTDGDGSQPVSQPATRGAPPGLRPSLLD
ncbi:MAG: hypothetical protein ACRD68_00690 [Pyrinomonadaceae bacterium]